MKVVISGSGLFAPEETISNDELVDSYNQYVEKINKQHATAIAAGQLEALKPSSSEFIVKASGIERRHVVDKKNILDVDVMCPKVAARADDALSLQCEMGLAAAKQALASAGKKASDVDMILVACSNMQRAYPAMAVELQHALGASGFAFDLNVACSSATFAVQTAFDAIAQGRARCALLINAEICTAHLNFCDRNSHFIFGDAATALVLEPEALTQSKQPFLILGTKLATQFSNNIRNNFGFLNRCEKNLHEEEKLFTQQGRKVFKEVIPLVVKHLQTHLQEAAIKAQDLKHMWLHQANSHMNELIAAKLLGHRASLAEAPMVLQEYGNTSSAGSIIAFHQYHQDMQAGDLGLICSFGAGYSVGSVILQTLSS